MLTLQRGTFMSSMRVRGLFRWDNNAISLFTGGIEEFAIGLLDVSTLIVCCFVVRTVQCFDVGDNCCARDWLPEKIPPIP